MQSQVLNSSSSNTKLTNAAANPTAYQAPISSRKGGQSTTRVIEVRYSIFSVASAPGVPMTDTQLAPIDHPAGWRGDAIGAQTDWIYHLSPDELAELEAVGARFVEEDPDLRFAKAAQYPLPLTASGLPSWARDMDTGRGFVLVRGLRSDVYSDELSAAIFFVLGLHLGEPMRQNELGDVFDHIIAISDLKVSDPNALASRTTDRLNFHSDSSDVVALMCLRGAKEGGASILMSGITIYNEVLARRPNLVHLLAEPWHYAWYKQDHDAPQRYYTSPMISNVDGVFSMYAGSRIIRSAQEYPEVPRMTAEQYELLDLLDQIYLEPGLPLTMDFRPGDIQWLLNYAALHSRTAYQDYPEYSRKRHLLRLWLKRDTNRPLVPNFGRHVVKSRDEGVDGIDPAKARFRITQVCRPRTEWGLETA